MQENGPGTGPFSDPTRGRVRGMPRATASGAVVPQPFASVVREDDIGMLPAERALVVDRERRPASFVRADPPALEGPGRGGQVAGSGSLGHLSDSTLTGEGFGPPIGRSRGDPGRA